MIGPPAKKLTAKKEVLSDDSKSIPPEVMNEEESQSKIDNLGSQGENDSQPGDESKVGQQVNLESESDKLEQPPDKENTQTKDVQESDLNEKEEDDNASEFYNEEDSHQEDDANEMTDKNSENRIEASNNRDIAEMEVEGKNLAPSHLRKISQETTDIISSRNNLSKDYQGVEADSVLSEVSLHKLTSGNITKSMIQSIDELNSKILQDKFNRHNDQIMFLVESFNDDQTDLVPLDSLDQFLSELVSLILIKFKYTNPQSLGESAVQNDIYEYMYEVATTELEPQNNGVTNCIDILTIFALIEKFLALWHGECELIDLEAPREQSHDESNISKSKEVAKSPPKYVGSKIQDTINQYEELINDLNPDDPAAIAYNEVLKTLKSKLVEIS